ncbi:MAG: hypothetical protein COB61_000110 [Thiotrichales bacterium]|nr:hypothetical protein [Thiotrichales bacterium]
MNNLSQQHHLVASLAFAIAGVGTQMALHSADEAIMLVNEGNDDGLEQEDGICRP